MRFPRSIAVTVATLSLVAGACSTAAGDATTGDSATTGDGVEPDTGATVQSQTTGRAGDAAQGDSRGVFPGAEWEMATADASGMDQGVLDEIAAKAEAGSSYCLVVTRDGRLVDERYWQDTEPTTPHEAFSATKSFTAVMTGIASDDGSLEVDDKASEWIPQWVGTPSEDVTVEQLLNNTSGRYQDFSTDYGEMAAQAADKTAYSIGLDQQHEPGSTWVYNNAAIQTLEAVISGATGSDVADLAQERLFDPLGMVDSSWARDQAGNSMTFMGVQSTCRDMARFGLMALNEGDWNGTQVVSADWMKHSTGESSQDLNTAYGWLWWLNRKGTVLGAEGASGGAASSAQVAPEESQMVKGAPEDMFFALGLGGQIIAIDPGTRTVVTRMGPSTYPPDVEKFTTDDAARVATEAVT